MRWKKRIPVHILHKKIDDKILLIASSWLTIMVNIEDVNLWYLEEDGFMENKHSRDKWVIFTFFLWGLSIQS